MKKLLATLLVLASILAACTDNEATTAATLLDAARTALHEQRFDDARTLIDSLRATCPKAFDARRTALLLSDSIELEEAKTVKTELDSLLIFKSFELEDAKSRFTLEKQEKYQSQGFYVLPKHAGDKSKHSFFPEVEESGKLLLVQIDANRKYSFTEVPVTDEGFMPYVCQLRLTESQIEDIAACYHLAQLFDEHKALVKQHEDTRVKVKFFEKKMESKQ